MDAKPIELVDDQPENSSSPWRDALVLFRRNRLAVLGLSVILGFIFIALTASFWSEIGLIDERRGFETRHELNPPGLEQVDPFADPLTCAREDLRADAAWCAVLPEETQLRYPDDCGSALQQPPDRQWCFVLGSNQAGEDWLTQVVYGTQISLAVAFIGSSLSLVLGMVYGLISGYYGGAVDNFMMRFVDFIIGVPGLVIIILMSVFFRQIAAEYADDGGLVGVILDLNRSMGGLLFLFIAIALFSWPGMARLTRGQVLAYREREFVEAARAIGASDRRIVITHLLPNIIGPLLVAETLTIPGYIFTEAFLSFIGLGVQPGTPSWGAMISQVRQIGGFQSNQHIWVVPSVALVSIALAFNFLGDGLRDALDPRLRGLK